MTIPFSVYACTWKWYFSNKEKQINMVVKAQQRHHQEMNSKQLYWTYQSILGNGHTKI